MEALGKLSFMNAGSYAKLLLVLVSLSLGLLSPTLGQIKMQRIGISDGLPQSAVYALDGDSLGNLWIGTLGGGVASFDGLKFSRVDIAAGLANDMIMDVKVRKDGLWIATQKGVSHFDGRAIRNFPTTDSFYPTKIFFSGDTVLFTALEGRMGMVVKDSLYSNVKLNRWQGVTNILRFSPGVLLLNLPSEHQCLLVSDQGPTRVYHTKSDIKKIHAVLSPGDTAMISTNLGVFRMAGDSLEQIMRLDFPIYFYDSQEQVFYGKKENSLVEVNRQGIVREVSEFRGLVGCMYQDIDGSRWLGTDRGLHKFTLPAFTKVGDEQDEEATMSLYANGREMFIGTASRGVSKVSANGSVETIDLGGGVKNYVTSIKADSMGTLYFGTGGGIAVYRNGRVTWKNPELVANSASLDIDRQGRVLAASTGPGAYLIEGDRVTTVEGLRNEVIQSINYNKSLDVFAMGSNGGLKLWKDGVIQHVSVQEFSGKQLSAVRWISADLMAVGTYGHGLFIYSFKEKKVTLKVDSDTGLSSNTIFIAYPKGNHLWVGTQTGIDRLTLSQEFNKVDAIDHFGEEDGLVGLETNQDAVLERSDGIYFGLVTGVYRYRGKTYKSPHPLHISDVKLFFNQTISKGNQYARTDLNNEFRHNENHLTFTFQKINKRDPGSTYYRYKLGGFDQVWSNPTTSNSVTYSNLPPGDFDFTVLATDKSGHFSFEEAHYRFVIHPNFYQTSWFPFLVMSALVALLVLGSYLYNRRRISQAIYIQELKDAEKVKLRKEIARDFHDELGNQLARMINFMSILRIRNELQKDVYETLSEYSQTILNGTKDFVWALDPANDDLGNVLIHLKDFAERMFFEKSIEFRFDGDAAVSIKLKLGFSRQINLIFKEAMTNAFRHSGASRVELSMALSDDRITIKLHDNGVGMASDQIEKSSRGLQNMRIRANRIGAQLRIQGQQGGTTIELSFPR